MKLERKKIIKRIKTIHQQLEEQLDIFHDDHEDTYVPFDAFGIGEYIGGYTLEYLTDHMDISLEKYFLSFSLPVPYDDEYLNGSIPYEWLDTFEVETFAKPILDKYIHNEKYINQIQSSIKKEYFYFPDSIEIPYTANYIDILDKGTIVGVKSKDPASFFKGIYGVDPIKIEDLKEVDTSQYKQVYELPADRTFLIKYYL